MNFPFTENFNKEVEKFNLKYKCIDCIHYNDETNLCSFEYPVNGDKSYFYIMDLGKQATPRFSFCKHFEYN